MPGSSDLLSPYPWIAVVAEHKGFVLEWHGLGRVRRGAASKHNQAERDMRPQDPRQLQDSCIPFSLNIRAL